MCTRKWKSNWINWKNRKSKRSLRSNIRLHYFPWYHVHLNAAMPFSNIEVSSKNADNASFVLVLRSLFLLSRSTPLLHPTGYKLFIMKNPRLVTARHYVWSISLWIPSLQLNALWTVFSFYWIFFFPFPCPTCSLFNDPSWIINFHYEKLSWIMQTNHQNCVSFESTWWVNIASEIMYPVGCHSAFGRIMGRDVLCGFKVKLPIDHHEPVAMFAGWEE